MLQAEQQEHSGSCFWGSVCRPVIPEALGGLALLHTELL